MKNAYIKVNSKWPSEYKRKNQIEFIFKDDMFLKKASSTYFILNDEEKKIFDFLLDVNKYYNLNITFRASGEWIRDKILHYPTNKIEIILDNIDSIQFSRIVQEYIQNNPNVSITSDPSHLSQFRRFETAVLNIFNVQLNFINLKPKHKIAEDEKGVESAFYKAHLKDFTINSLYYNINEDTIEDFTRKGISDMVEGLISTPHNPYSMLSKYPINALRAIYYSIKYNFEIEKYLRITMCNKDIKNIVLSRVPQRKRNYELGLILRLPHATKAIKLIYEMDYFDCLIPFPDIEYEFNDWDRTLVKQALYYNELYSLIINNDHITNMKRSLTEDERAVFHYLSLVLNMITCEGIEKISSRIKKTLISANITTLNINRTASSIIEKSYLLFYILQRILHSLDSQLKDMTTAESANFVLDVMRSKFPQDFIKFVTLIRKSKHYWPFVVLYTSMHKFVGNDSVQSINFESALVQAIKDRNIDNVITMELILDGNDIQEILKIGCCPLIGTVLDSLYVWQLSNLDATREEAIEYVLENFKDEPSWK